MLQIVQDLRYVLYENCTRNYNASLILVDIAWNYVLKASRPVTLLSILRCDSPFFKTGQPGHKSSEVHVKFVFNDKTFFHLGQFLKICSYIESRHLIYHSVM